MRERRRERKMRGRKRNKVPRGKMGESGSPLDFGKGERETEKEEEGRKEEGR